MRELRRPSWGMAVLVSGLFGMDPKTVRRGLIELDLEDDPATSQVRKKGRGAQGGE